jgi:chromosome segregation ATPase
MSIERKYAVRVPVAADDSRGAEPDDPADSNEGGLKARQSAAPRPEIPESPAANTHEASGVQNLHGELQNQLADIRTRLSAIDRQASQVTTDRNPINAIQEPATEEIKVLDSRITELEARTRQLAGKTGI